MTINHKKDRAVRKSHKNAKYLTIDSTSYKITTNRSSPNRIGVWFDKITHQCHVKKIGHMCNLLFFLSICVRRTGHRRQALSCPMILALLSTPPHRAPRMILLRYFVSSPRRAGGAAWTVRLWRWPSLGFSCAETCITLRAHHGFSSSLYRWVGLAVKFISIVDWMWIARAPLKQRRFDFCDLRIWLFLYIGLAE